MKFSNLFQPINIGKITLKNRLAMAPIVLFGDPLYNHQSQSMTPEGIEYYVERARGGVGLIITGGFKVPHEIEYPGWPEVRPQGIQALREMADLCHVYDCKVFIQLSPGSGRNIMPQELTKGKIPVSSSNLPSVWDPNIICKKITREEIKSILTGYVQATEIVANTGIDGIEVHGHEGYLLDQFVTELFNRRTDEYGGNFENRLRFPIEILNSIKDVIGKNFPVTYRMGIKHFVKDLRVGALRAKGYREKGRDLSETHIIISRLEKEGYDGFHLDTGCYDSWFWAHPPIYMGHGPHLDLMKGFTEDVEVPIITANRLGLPELAHKVVRDKLAHIVALGRALLADPEFPKKLKRGDLEDIRPCIGCADGCQGHVIKLGRGLSCSVNPSCGREISTKLTPVVKSKNIVVIGGGPAGMELARVATLRGHKVKIFEKEDSLGGHLKEGSVPDFKLDVKRLLNWYTVQIERLGVVVELQNEIISSDISALENADIVVVATGSTPIIPSIIGIQGSNVLTCEDALIDKTKIGENVTVIGGGLEGCETAYWLAIQDKKVTLLEKLSDLMLTRPVFYTNRNYLIGLLHEANVFIMTNVIIEKIEKEGVTITQRLAMDRTENQDIYCTGKPRIIPCDTVVLAVGYRSQDRLYQSLRNKMKETYKIGDCKAVGKIHDAVWDGFTLGKYI